MGSEMCIRDSSNTATNICMLGALQWPSRKLAAWSPSLPTVMQNPAAQLGPAWAGATAPLTRPLPVTQERVQARTADDRFDACVTGAVRALDDAQQGSGLYHHIGASAEQQIIAGTGLIPAPPGSHMMSTRRILRRRCQWRGGLGLGNTSQNLACARALFGAPTARLTVKLGG